MEVRRVEPKDAKAMMEKGALMVCAYEDEIKFAAVKIKGAISIGEFRQLRPNLEKETKIIFYCA